MWVREWTSSQSPYIDSFPRGDGLVLLEPSVAHDSASPILQIIDTDTPNYLDSQPFDKF